MENAFGKRSLGRARDPPIKGLYQWQFPHHAYDSPRSDLTYPSDIPIDQVTGIKAKASARLVGSVNSPIRLFMTPFFEISEDVFQDMVKHANRCFRLTGHTDNDCIEQ